MALRILLARLSQTPIALRGNVARGRRSWSCTSDAPSTRDLTLPGSVADGRKNARSLLPPCPVPCPGSYLTSRIVSEQLLTVP
eukprot:4546434-Prymnesium_polylepis.1